MSGAENEAQAFVSLGPVIDLYRALEPVLGKECAIKAAKALESLLAEMEERMLEIACQYKMEIKEEIRRELREELRR